MKAVMLVKNGSLIYSEVSEKDLAEDECKIEVKAAGICSSDIFRGFENGAYFYPLIMGHEFSGKIVQIGKSVERNLKIGDHVSIFPLLPCFNCDSCQSKKYAQCTKYDYYGSRRDGGYSDFINIKNWNIVKLGHQIDYIDGAALEPISVVLHAVKKLGDINQIKNLAIIGAGFLGLITLKYLKENWPELSVTMIDRNSFKLNIAQNLGSEIVKIEDEKEWEEYLKSLSASFSHVIESCGVPLTFRHSINITARSGTLVWMGNISDQLILSKKEISSILRKEITISGTWNSDYDGENKSDWTDAIDILNNGFSIRDLITEFVSLTDLPKALEKLHANKMRLEKHELIKIFVQN